ncbi:MAG: hypothetical protein ACOC2W_00070 [bacterium]
MITIDHEAKRNKRLPIDIDNFSERYKTTSGLYIFTSPDFSVLERNIYFLLVNSEEKKFNTKYKYKPSYLSYDEYGTIVLSPLLMYVNNVMCIEDFDLKRVVVPRLSAIKEVCKDKITRRDPSDLQEINW